MSNPHRSYLPPEILDRIVDYLHYQRETLNQCCLVSKSWIPRTRKHLFAELYFSYECDHKAWKKAFPDCSRSPVHHTHTLRLDILKNIVAWSAEEDIWIPIFSRVLSSGLNGCHKKTEIRLDPFYTFSSSLKSLRVVTLGVPSPTMFDGVWSIRLLENLTSIVQNISTIRCTWYYEQDLRWIAALLAGCPDTLECVDIECRPYQTAWEDSIDLSKAIKLKQVTFRLGTPYVVWIIMALRTITSKHRDLQQISIYVPSRSTSTRDQETVSRQWMDLDRLLVQVWESHAIRTKVICGAAEKKVMCGYIGSLLPEITKRGIIELVESV